MQLGTIYCLENTVTDKMYIGKTTNFKKRMRDYATGNGHGYIGKSINKHGWKNFSVMQVETIPVEDLNDAEKFWIDFLDTIRPNGYNLRSGGEGGAHSPESRELMREAALRRVEDGTNPFVVNNPARENAMRLMREGKHLFQTNNPGPEVTRKRMEDGTHQFLTNHPMRDPEIMARKQRTQRDNRPTIDWVDLITDQEEE